MTSLTVLKAASTKSENFKIRYLYGRSIYSTEY